MSGQIDTSNLSFDLTSTESGSFYFNTHTMYTISGSLYLEQHIISGTLEGDYNYAMNVYGY